MPIMPLEKLNPITKKAKLIKELLILWMKILKKNSKQNLDS